MSDITLTPTHCRMARAGLEMGAAALDEAAGLPAGTVVAFEAGLGPDAAGALMAALSAAGVRIVASDNRGVAVYVQTDRRTRPVLSPSGNLRYRSPSSGLCPRWMGESIIAWGGVVVVEMEGAGDAVRATLPGTDAGSLGPLYFGSPDDVTHFLAEAIVAQSLVEAAPLNAALVARRYLAEANRCGADVKVAVDRDGVTATLTPSQAMVEHMPDTIYPRGPLSLNSARDWLTEASMLAFVLRPRDLEEDAALLAEFEAFTGTNDAD